MSANTLALLPVTLAVKNTFVVVEEEGVRAKDQRRHASVPPSVRLGLQEHTPEASTTASDYSSDDGTPLAGSSTASPRNHCEDMVFGEMLPMDSPSEEDTNNVSGFPVYTFSHMTGAPPSFQHASGNGGQPASDLSLPVPPYFAAYGSYEAGAFPSVDGCADVVQGHCHDFGISAGSQFSATIPPVPESVQHGDALAMLGARQAKTWRMPLSSSAKAWIPKQEPPKSGALNPSAKPWIADHIPPIGNQGCGDAWIPDQTPQNVIRGDAVPTNKKPEYLISRDCGYAVITQYKHVAETVCKRLTDSQHVDSAEVVEGQSTWSIIARVQPQHLHDQREQLLTLAKSSLLEIAAEDGGVHILGRQTKPFENKPWGFSCTFGVMLDKSKACRLAFQKGFCCHWPKCSWEHPVHQMGVDVVLKKSRSNVSS